MADLNRAGRTYAQSLIDDGKVNKDSAWTFTAADGDKLLGMNGNDWANYGKNHLGADANENFDTKAHWKYPFAKDGTLYRSALIAIRDRSGQRKDKSIFTAAGALLDEIDGETDRTHENSTTGEEAGTDVIDSIHIKARPPRIELEIQPRMEVMTPPVSETALDKWNGGLRLAVDTDNVNLIQIYDVIGFDPWTGGITAQSISDQLKAFNGGDCEVHINSPGGDMFEGIAIYNLLQAYPGKVECKIMGLAASAASVIAMAGDEVLIGDGAFLMIHNCWVMAMGNRHDMQEVANYLEPFDQALASIYVKKTGQKMAQVSKWMDDETYLNAQQCINLGFCGDTISNDAITEDSEAANKAKALNSVRKIEAALTRKGGYSRSQARALMKDAKLDAGLQNESDNKPDAVVVDTTQDAGDLSWIAAAQALADLLKKK